MNDTPDAWDDEWSTAADQAPAVDIPKLSSKQTKAQKRAAQAEFNRQLWAEAEGPQETNYFLESRNVVPLRQEFKAAPTLLSRKGPIVQKPRPAHTPTDPNLALSNLSLKDKAESSEDEDEVATQLKALEAAKIQAAKDREEKQRKYEERRLELFGPKDNQPNTNSRSGHSTPASLTPPGSRSSTPARGGKRGRGRGGQNQNQQRNQQQLKEVYDAAYSAKPGSTFLLRRETGQGQSESSVVQPIREPRAPDGSGRGGAGFVQSFAHKRKTSVLNPAAAEYQVQSV